MSDTFILELPLKITAYHERKLLKRLEAARQVYNACLGEALRRLASFRNTKKYRTALDMPKRTKKEKRTRTRAFYEIKRTVGLTEYQMYAYTKQFNHSWLAYHLDSHVNRRLAKRAFQAVERFMYGIDKPCKRGKCLKPLGKRKCSVCGRPRFKCRGEINSVEGENNTQSIRWLDGNVVWSSSERVKLVIPAVVDYDDPVQSHGLSSRIKYVRMLRKVINGRNRFYAQLVLEGTPLQRTPVAEGCMVGLDLGPSSIAAYDGTRAFLKEFCADVEDASKEIRRLQRRLDRQRRANNPDCYDGKGRAIRGKRPRNKSKRMKRTEVRIAETERRLAAHRKTMQGQLVNIILGMGNVIQMEKLSYKAWQRRWGKSVKKHAPATFVSSLRRKAASTGGEVREFSTYSTRLSQTDHKTGRREKKSLSQRWHHFEDGTKVQRDLYSAFLAFCVNADTDTLDADLAGKLWSQGAGSLLLAAFGEASQLAKKRGFAPACFGISQSQSESSGNLVRT